MMLRVDSRRTRRCHAASLVLSALVLLLAPRAAHGQMPERDSSVVALGDTVRLDAGSRRLAEGILVDTTRGTMLVRDPIGDTVRIVRAFVTHAEVRRGERQRGVSTFVRTAVGGTVLGFVTFLATVARAPKNDPFAGVVGIAAGGAIAFGGVVAGAVAAGTYAEVWLPFDPETGRIPAPPSAP